MSRILYHLPLSPACRAIRLQLAEKQLDCRLVEEPVWQGREEFFALNPAGDVPVLVEADGSVVCGGYAIAEYLEEAYVASGLLGATPATRAETRRLMQWTGEKLCEEVTRPLLFEKVYRRQMQCGGPDTDLIRLAKENLQYHLDYFSELLSHRDWLGGDAMTLADLTAAAHLSSLDFLGDVAWSQAQGLREWYALIKSRPSFRTLLLDRVLGFHPPSYYGNPDF